MARPNLNKLAHRPSPWIDEDGDILVSSASGTSSDTDPELDSSAHAAPGKKPPSVFPKSHATPSTSHSVADTDTDTENVHTAPALRTKRSKPTAHAYPGSTASPRPLDHRRVPFPIDSALRDALHGGKPLLTAIFGTAVVRALIELERCIPSTLSVSNGEYIIQMTVQIAASTDLSNTNHATLKHAAKQVTDRDQWDRIIREGKEKLDPENFPATVLGNADVSCKMVFRLLQML